MKKRKFLKTIGLFSIPSIFTAPLFTQNAISASIKTTEKILLPFNWKNPNIKLSFDEFVLKNNEIEENKPLFITIKAGRNNNLTKIKEFNPDVNLNKGDNKITSYVGPINLTKNDSLNISDIDLTTANSFDIDIKVIVNYGQYTIETTDIVTVEIIDEPGTTTYTYTNSSTYVRKIDVSNINKTIEVILKGAVGGNGNSRGGQGAYVKADIDVSSYNNLVVAPGQSGSYGGNGLRSGGRGKYDAGNGGGSTEIRSETEDGEVLVYAGAGAGSYYNSSSCRGLCGLGGGGGAPGGSGGGGDWYSGNPADGTGNGGDGNSGDGGPPDSSEVPSTVNIQSSVSTVGGSTGNEDGHGVIQLFTDS